MTSAGALQVPNPTNNQSGEGYSFGQFFTVLYATDLETLYWYHGGSDPQPSKVTIYDLTGGGVHWTYTTQAGDFAGSGSGWYALDLTALGSPPSPLVANHAYVLTYYLGTANSIQRYGATPSAQAGWGWNGQGWSAGDVANVEFRGTNLSYNIDLGGTQTPGGGGTPSITADLAAWLSTDAAVQTHEADGLPYATKAALDSLAGDVATIAGEVDGLHAKISADGVTWDAKLGPLQLYGGVTNLGISAGLEIVRTDVAGKASQSSVDGLATESSAVAAAVALMLALRRNALTDFPSSPWVNTASIAFDTDLAWSEPADLYVVTFADLGSNRVNTVVAGVDVSYRLAWWCPLIGAFAQQRRFIDTPSAHLWENGIRMPGLLLRSGAGGSGTVDAWVYD